MGLKDAIQTRQEAEKVIESLESSKVRFFGDFKIIKRIDEEINKLKTIFSLGNKNGFCKKSETAESQTDLNNFS